MHECGGSRSECNEVRQKRCVRRTEAEVEREREREREGEAVKTKGHCGKKRVETRDHKTDSTDLSVSIQNGSFCNLPAPAHSFQNRKCVCVCVFVCVCDGRVGGMRYG